MKWGALPKAGGMEDQSYKQMFQMNVLARVFDASQAFKNTSKKMTKDQNDIIKWLVDIGVK